MKKITEKDIANYIIESFTELFEDGYYYIHYSPNEGLNYEGNLNPENITVCVPCFYAHMLSRKEIDAKESLDDSDFMWICKNLSEKLNKKLENL